MKVLSIRDDCSARELIDSAKEIFGVGSCYGVARECGLDAHVVARYYRNNRIPRSARWSIMNAMLNG